MRSQLARPLAWGAVLIVIVGGLLSCSCNTNKGGVSKGSGVYISSSTSLAPDANPGPQTINYGGTEIAAESQTANEGGQFSIDLIYNGVSLEKEIYQSLPDKFTLVNAAGEEYKPPIPLITFPMNAGDQWNWEGEMMTGPMGRKATAVISTREDKIDVGYLADALVVEVDLKMESGASAPAPRKLTFWFVKDKGLVKREFGASTSRKPRVVKESDQEPAGQ